MSGGRSLRWAALAFALVSVLGLGCGDDSSPPSDGGGAVDSGAGGDGGAVDAAAVTDGGGDMGCIGSACPSGQMCCLGAPYPAEGLCADMCTMRSDRAQKRDIRPVDPDAVLNRLATVPIQQWRYSDEPEGVQHVGPMAQDFRAAYGLGTDDRTIHSVDASGVAMAAIQALHRRVEALDRKSRALEAENGALRRRVRALERR